jgi:hypothetical protein
VKQTGHPGEAQVLEQEEHYSVTAVQRGSREARERTRRARKVQEGKADNEAAVDKDVQQVEQI